MSGETEEGPAEYPTTSALQSGSFFWVSQGKNRAIR